MGREFWLLPLGVLVVILFLALMFNAQETEKEVIAFQDHEENAPMSPLVPKETSFRDYGLQEMVFNLLPVVPENFYEKAKLSNQNIPPEVFKQPEFIHNNWFENNCLEYYSENRSYRGILGYGFYPNYKRVVLENGVTEFESEFFVHSACGIEVFQSMHLVVSDSEFVEVELSESDFVLEPTVPVIHSNWIHKITVTGKIKEGTPDGTHIVSVNPESLFGIGKDFFQLKVVVK